MDRQSFVGTKLNPFKNKVNKYKKTNPKLEKYLAEFQFLIQVKETPKKRKLKKKISELEFDKYVLKGESDKKTTEVQSLEIVLEEKDKEIEEIEELLDILQRERE